MIFYSPSQNGFYDSKLHGGNIPKDSIEIPGSYHIELINAQSSGKFITSREDGWPISVDYSISSDPPSSCTPVQWFVALFALKKITEDDVQYSINGISDDVERYTTQISFKRATVFERDSQSMKTMARLLSLSSSDLDELFLYAETVQA